MDDLDVKIVQLPPMRVACVNGFGESPEAMAFGKMRAWAMAHSLPNGPQRIFGYNNPNPSPGSPNYGYDVWLTVDESLQADGEARMIEFSGGLYAVTRIHVREPGDEIPRAWQNLVRWLEEHIGPLDESVNDTPFTLDLHLPISE